MSEGPGLMDVISRLTSNTDEVWKHLVCPPKQRYSTESLGPPIQMWGGNTFRRHDLSFRNAKGLKICFSLYLNESMEPDEEMYTIVYLHSHGGCKIEGYHLMKVFSEKTRAHLCLFDFAGCGHSEGDHLSMGAEEPDDVCSLLQVLARDFGVKYFAIWGRSMGAAVALLSLPRLSGVFSLVLDSPFSEVRNVYRNAVRQRMALPGVLIDLVFNYANSEIKRVYGFDVSELRPFDNASKINVPTVLMGAQEDKITSYEDLLELYNAIPQPEDLKVVVPCRGNHNDDREHETLKSTMEFIQIIFSRLKAQNKSARNQRTLGGMPKYDRKPMNRQTEKAQNEWNRESSGQIHHSLPRKDGYLMRGAGLETPSYKSHSVNPAMQRSITAGAMEDSRRAILNSSFGTPSSYIKEETRPNQAAKLAPGPHSGRRSPLGNFQYSLGSLGQSPMLLSQGPGRGRRLRTIYDAAEDPIIEDSTPVVDLIVPVPPDQIADQTYNSRNGYKPISQAYAGRQKDYDQPTDLRGVRSFKDYAETPIQSSQDNNLGNFQTLPSQPGWIVTSQGYENSLASQQTAPTLMTSNSNSNYQVNQVLAEPKQQPYPMMISPTSSLNIPLPSHQKPSHLRDQSPRPAPMVLLPPMKSRANPNPASGYDNSFQTKPTPGAQMAAAREFNRERALTEGSLSSGQYQSIQNFANQSSAMQNLQTLLNFQGNTQPKQVQGQSDSYRVGQRNPLARTFGDTNPQGVSFEPNSRFEAYPPAQQQQFHPMTVNPPNKVHYNTPIDKKRDAGDTPKPVTAPFQYQPSMPSEVLGRIDPTRSINQSAFVSLSDNVGILPSGGSQQAQTTQPGVAPSAQFLPTNAAQKQGYGQSGHKHLLPGVIPQIVRPAVQSPSGSGPQASQQNQAPFTSFITSQAHMDKFFSRPVEPAVPQQNQANPPHAALYEHFQGTQFPGAQSMPMPQNPQVLIQSQTKAAFGMLFDPRGFSSPYGPTAS